MTSHFETQWTEGALWLINWFLERHPQYRGKFLLTDPLSDAILKAL